MALSSSKENILKKIRQALAQPVPVPFPQSEGSDNIFVASNQLLEIEFAENFSKLQGRFSFCTTENELVEQLTTLITTRKWNNIFCSEEEIKKLLPDIPTQSTNLNNCDVSITSCETLIARTGSIVLSSFLPNGRTASVYAPVHICIAYTHQLVYDVKDALNVLKDKYQEQIPSLITLATGPSRTADIEKTLVVGVHGPKEVFCFIIDKT